MVAKAIIVLVVDGVAVIVVVVEMAIVVLVLFLFVMMGVVFETGGPIGCRYCCGQVNDSGHVKSCGVGGCFDSVVMVVLVVSAVAKVVMAMKKMITANVRKVLITKMHTRSSFRIGDGTVFLNDGE